MAKKAKVESKSSNLVNELMKSLNNEYASVADSGIISDTDVFIDTGSYVVNALISGSIYGGYASNRITAIAGEEATGKTYFAISSCKSFLDANPDGFVFYFDSESAITKKQLADRGIDLKRVAIIPVDTVENFKFQMVKLLDGYMKTENRPPMFIVLDSMGQLSTRKELGDAAEGSDTKDMTRAAVLKAAFRIIQLKLAKAKVPLLVTNHVYAVVGSFFPQKELGGGSGLKYSASTIIGLTKAKEKDSAGNKVGAIVTCTANKSRFTKEGSKIKTCILFSRGLLRHYGLLDLALEFGIVTEKGNKYVFPNGELASNKQLNLEPETWFTKEVLDRIDAGCKQKFLYGSPNDVQVDIEATEESVSEQDE